jgi:hypothetical protein
MTDQKQSPWVTWVALTTATMAVFAAVTTLYVGKYSSRAVLLQGQETNQWAYFQSKSIKSHTFELQLERMRLDLLAGAAGKSRAAEERYRKTMVSYEETVARYGREMGEIKAKAESLGSDKQQAQLRAGNYGYALIFLQIAIMLSSIAVIVKRPSLWYLGLASTAGWIYFFLNGVFMFR